MRRVASLAILAAILCLPAAGHAATSTKSWLSVADAQLPELQVEAPGPMTGYSRAKFGPAWHDVDHNGCDTRNDMLKRDLRFKVFKVGSNCVVQKGTLHDPYTGTTIHFVRGVATSAAVQIDHVVALGNAWRSGAATWTAARRLAYANDPVVLLAVDGPSNEAKGDDNAAQWVPPLKSYDCRYAARQIAIKTKYDLSLTKPEHDTMKSLLAACKR
jgi:hypothetical protein